MVHHATLDDYINQLPVKVREQAETLRGTIMKSAMGLVETVRYNMPAFEFENETVIHFAVWKKHIGLYPVYRGADSFETRLKPYRANRDTVRLPLDSPIPQKLVAEIVRSQISKLAQNSRRL